MSSAVAKLHDDMDEPIGRAMPGGMFISDEQLRRLNPDLSKARRMMRQVLMDAKEPKIVRGPTAKPANVRIAGPSDEVAIFELLKMDHEECGRFAPLDVAKLQNIIMHGTRRKGGIVSVIDGPNGKPVAVQILTTEEWWWSKQRFISKIADFVHPDHRQSTHAAHLIQFAKWVTDQWSAEFGYQMYLLPAVLGTKKVKEKVRLYSRHVTQAGAFFLYPWPYSWD